MRVRGSDGAVAGVRLQGPATIASVRVALIAVVALGCGRTAPYGVVAAAAKAAANPPPAPACIMSTDASPKASWQRWQSPAVVCFGMTFFGHGVDGEYAFAKIPAEDDPGWQAETSPNISFNQKSRLCDPSVPCGCSAGGDFTYFQTRLELKHLPARAEVDIEDVDDGVEVTLFNDAHDSGVVAGHAYYPGGATADFVDDVVVGSNRLVLTHIDDCCEESRIANAQVVIDGNDVTRCQ
jgi:hypothetical protein